MEYYIQINTEENKSHSYNTKNHSPFAHPVFKYLFHS